MDGAFATYVVIWFFAVVWLTFFAMLALTAFKAWRKHKFRITAKGILIAFAAVTVVVLSIVFGELQVLFALLNRTVPTARRLAYSAGLFRAVREHSLHTSANC